MEATARKKYLTSKGKLLLNIAGEEAITLSLTFGLAEADKFNFVKLKEKFESYAIPKTNQTYNRFCFNRCRQKEGETFDKFLTEARRLIKDCGFGGGELEESILRDRIVEGVLDNNLRTAMLRNADLKLQQAIDDCKAAEQSKKYAEDMGQPQPQTVVQTDATRFDRDKPKKVFIKKAYSRPNQESQQNRRPRSSFFKCSKCNYTHDFGKCPAFGKTCMKCGEKNHFAATCGGTYNVKTHAVETEEVAESEYEVETEEPEHEEEYVYFYTDSVVTVNSMQTEYRQDLLVQGKKVNFKLDPGASMSILPYDVFKSLNAPEKIQPCKIMIQPYGSKTPSLPALGCVKLQVSVPKQSEEVTFVVAGEGDTPLFGIRDCELFKLISRNFIKIDSVETPLSSEEFIKKHSDVFEGIGRFPGEHSILIQPEAQQVIRPPLRKPHSVHAKLKPALDALEGKKIIQKVDQISNESWVSNLVIVEKPNGSIRICLDPSDLNKVIIRQPHLIPTINDLSDKLNHKKLYTLLDLKDGFYHIVLDSKSADKCCFSTPFGIYQFLRCPFGLSSAPELFQKVNETIFSGIKNVLKYLDDLLVVGDTEAEHDEALDAVMERARQCGVRFNPDKLQYRKSSVRYVGHVFSEKGKSPCDERIRDLMKLQCPKSVKELQSILGMFNYVRDFIPNMSAVISNIRLLLKKGVTFLWTSVHTAELEKLKQLASSAPVLANFDATKKIIVQTDASQQGLGACLLQEGHPVAFASRSLSPSELNYSVTEKEMLGIYFGLTKFHDRTYGHDVEVHTDHLPLVSTMVKPLHAIGSRVLQRIRLKLFKYSLTVKHLPGKYMFIADVLSRYVSNDPSVDDSSVHEVVHSVSMVLPFSNLAKAEIAAETAKDAALQCIVSYVQNGWPKNVLQAPESVQPFWRVRNDLFCEGGIVLVSDCNIVKVVVPASLRPKMLSLIHKGHMGIQKCLTRAKEVFYWPSMSYHVELFVNQCKVCEKFRPAASKHSLISYPLPKCPWERVSVDIGTFNSQDYLVFYDAYSKWLEIKPINSKSAATAIEKCKEVFMTHGNPAFLHCDNNPFNSSEFLMYAQTNHFEVVTSSPNFPSSNGRAEKGINIAKLILKKCNVDRSDFRDSLREYNNTCVPSMSASPAEMLMSRKIRTVLPVSCNALKPKVQNQVYDKMVQQQMRTEKWYNTSVRKDFELQPGDKVVVNCGQKGETWEPGTVVKKLKQPRSYLIENCKGNVVRRTLQHLCKSESPCDIKNNHFELYPLASKPENRVTNPEVIINNVVNKQKAVGTPTMSTYQLLVPDWLFEVRPTNVSKFGRVLKPTQKYSPP